MENSILIEQNSIVNDDDISIEVDTNMYQKNVLLDYQNNLVINGETIDITYSNAYMYFKKMHIVCPISSVNKFYLNEVVTDKMNSMIKDNMIVHTLDNLSLLTNNFFSSNMKILSKEQLDKFRNIGQEFNKNNLVIFIISINYFNLKNFLDMFERNKTIEDLHKIIIMSDFFKLDKNHYKVNSEITKIISNLDGHNFWSLPYNTQYNYDFIIKNRVIEKYNSVNTNVNSYDTLIIPLHKKLNISNLENNGKKIFRKVVPSDYSIDMTNQLFKYFMIDENKMSNINNIIVEQFMINPSLCHLIVNNPFILEKVKHNNLFDNKFKKNLGYCWLRFYNDELIKENNINKNDYNIFSINTASILPSYPIDGYNLKENPYFSMMVSDKIINASNNILGIMVDKNIRLANFNEFQRNLNIFITGKPYINIFEGIDLVEKNIAICGSILPACSVLHHPNLSKFNNNMLAMNEDEEVVDAIQRRFYAEYYSKSDIDMMISNCNHYKFCKIANDVYNDLLLNFCRFFRDAEPELFKLQEIKSIGLFMTEKYLKENNFTDTMIKQLKEFIENNDNDNIYNMVKVNIANIYDNIIINEYNELNDSDKKYCDNFLPTFKTKFDELKSKNILVEFNTKIVDTIFGSETEEIKVYVNTKYCVSSPFLNHDIEIFRNKDKDPFYLISKFHLNCVRGYYDGMDVHMLPSCITALKTFINMDFKYFAGKRSPYKIINKYRMRGFGTILNKKEISEYTKYINTTPFKKFFNNSCNNPTCTNCSRSTGFIDCNNRFFNPRKEFPEDFVEDKIQIFDLAYNNVNHKIVINNNYSPLVISTNGSIISL